MPVRAFIGLGANLGDAAQAFDQAIAALRALPGSRDVVESPRYRSEPIDSSGADYLNSVVSLSTPLAPEALLAELHRIEQAHGRERPYRNAPRTLDLDLLVHGDVVVASDTLTVPHPRLHERAFVLHPLADLAPELEVPGLPPLAALLDAVRGQRVERLG